MTIYSGFSHEKWWFSIVMWVSPWLFQGKTQDFVMDFPGVQSLCHDLSWRMSQNFSKPPRFWSCFFTSSEYLDRSVSLSESKGMKYQSVSSCCSISKAFWILGSTMVIDSHPAEPGSFESLWHKFHKRQTSISIISYNIYIDKPKNQIQDDTSSLERTACINAWRVHLVFCKIMAE